MARPALCATSDSSAVVGMGIYDSVWGRSCHMLVDCGLVHWYVLVKTNTVVGCVTLCWGFVQDWDFVCLVCASQIIGLHHP